MRAPSGPPRPRRPWGRAQKQPYLSFTSAACGRITHREIYPVASLLFPQGWCPLNKLSLKPRSLNSRARPGCRCIHQSLLCRLPHSRPWPRPGLARVHQLPRPLTASTTATSTDAFNKQELTDRQYLPLIPQHPGTLEHHPLLGPRVTPSKFGSSPVLMQTTALCEALCNSTNTLCVVRCDSRF